VSVAQGTLHSWNLHSLIGEIVAFLRIIAYMANEGHKLKQFTVPLEAEGEKKVTLLLHLMRKRTLHIDDKIGRQ